MKRILGVLAIVAIAFNGFTKEQVKSKPAPQAVKASGPKIEKSPWSIYIHGKAFTATQEIVNGKLFVDKKEILKDLGLPGNIELPKEALFNVNGKTLLWLPAVVQLSTDILMINKETYIIDVTILKAAAPTNKKTGSGANIITTDTPEESKPAPKESPTSGSSASGYDPNAPLPTSTPLPPSHK